MLNPRVTLGEHKKKLVNHEPQAFRLFSLRPKRLYYAVTYEENVVRCPYKTISSSSWQFHEKLLTSLYHHQTTRDSQRYKNEFTGTKTIGFLPIRSGVISELFCKFKCGHYLCRRSIQLSNLYNSKF